MLRATRLRAALLALLAVACAAPSEPESTDWQALTAELARRVAEDQDVRTRLMEGSAMEPDLIERMVAIDADNTAWMKALVDAHGWPGRSRVGAEGAGNAWLLVQHADEDVAFQERCIPLLRAAVVAGEAEPRHLAYLEDRVAMHRGRPQRYGTQFRPREDGSGYEPYPLEDPERVDEHRAAVGLEPLAEYAKRFE